VERNGSVPLYVCLVREHRSGVVLEKRIFVEYPELASSKKSIEPALFVSRVPSACFPSASRLTCEPCLRAAETPCLCTAVSSACAHPRLPAHHPKPGLRAASSSTPHVVPGLHGRHALHHDVPPSWRASSLSSSLLVYLVKHPNFELMVIRWLREET
jgi:hypothetical protein